MACTYNSGGDEVMTLYAHLSGGEVAGSGHCRRRTIGERQHGTLDGIHLHFGVYPLQETGNDYKGYRSIRYRVWRT